MTVTGKGLISLRKLDVEGSKPIALGFKKLVFAHRATIGETGISLTALVTPPAMLALGFVQPTAAEITTAQLTFFRKNLRLTSSVSGEMVDYVKYTIGSNSRINFVGFTAAAGEVFVGVIDHAPVTGIQVADAAVAVSTGDLAALTVDFNTVSAFEVNKYPFTQVGSVLVYVDGVLQLRNIGNVTAAPAAPGAYQEINNGSGLGTTIRFNNTSVSIRKIVVVSNGTLVNRSNSSRDQAIESLAGQVDVMIPYLATVAAVAQTTFQAAPNNVDIKTFADKVVALQSFRLVSTATTANGPVDYLLVNTTAAAVTITLPIAPGVGHFIEIWDSHGTWATNNLTVNRNGQLVEGVAANFTVATANRRIKLVFVSAARGWILAAYN